MLCGVCRCGRGVVGGRGVFGVLRHAEKSEKKTVYTFKTPPCVHSKRPRVYRHQAHMYETCGLAAGTHGNVLNVHMETRSMHTPLGVALR